MTDSILQACSATAIPLSCIGRDNFSSLRSFNFFFSSFSSDFELSLEVDHVVGGDRLRGTY